MVLEVYRSAFHPGAVFRDGKIACGWSTGRVVVTGKGQLFGNCIHNIIYPHWNAIKKLFLVNLWVYNKFNSH